MKPFMRLGLVCIALGAFGSLWEFSALQPPASIWHFGGYPLAAARFAQHGFITGFAALLLAPDDGRRHRALLAVATIGATLALGADAVTAGTAWRGIVVQDARAGSAALLTVRVVGGLLQLVALAWASVLRWTSPPRSPSA